MAPEWNTHQPCTNDSYTTPPSQAGRYKVQVSNSFGCTTTSNVDTVVRLHTPIANIIIVNPAGNPDLCINEKVKLRGNGSSTVSLGYEWFRNNISIATTRDYLATIVGNYQVKVTDLSTGCSRISSVVSVFSSCRTEESFAAQAVLNLYPNPTDGHFVVDLNLNNNQTGSAMMQVFNAIGQSVYGKMVPVTDGKLLEEIQLDENDAAGLYFIRIVMDDKAYKGQIIYQK
jgi:hypothetical protein